MLLKGVEDGTFVFFSNYDSAKGHQLLVNPYAALHLGWYPLQRQVRVEGLATRVPREESEAYFATRPRGSQLGAWASPQSSEVSGVEELASAYARVERRFEGETVPCPPHWGGFRVRAVDDRVLAGPAQPHARPPPLRPHRRRLDPHPPGAVADWVTRCTTMVCRHTQSRSGTDLHLGHRVGRSVQPRCWSARATWAAIAHGRP